MKYYNEYIGFRGEVCCHATSGLFSTKAYFSYLLISDDCQTIAIRFCPSGKS